MNSIPTRHVFKAVLQFAVGIGIVAALGIAAYQFIPQVKTPPGWHTVQPPHDVMAMVQFQDRIWAGGRDGLYIIDPNSFELIEEVILSIPLDYVSALLVSQNGETLWVGHLLGLSRYDLSGWTHYSQADGLGADQVLSLAQSAAGELYVGTSGGLSRFANGVWQNLTTADGLASNSVDVIAIGPDGRIWLGSRNTQAGGASVYDGSAWTTFTVENGLPNNSVNSIFFSRDGSVWLACGFSYMGGLAKLNGQNWQYQDSKDGLPSDHIRLIYQDRFNIIWIGTEYSGITAADQQGQTRLFTPDNGLVGWEVKSMLMDVDGNLWFGTERGITVIEAWAYQQLWN